MDIPNEHQTIMPYLILDQASQFRDFVKTVFNAEDLMMRLREDGKAIMHAEVRINDSTMMYAESTPEWNEQTANLFIYVEDADNTFYEALDNAGEMVMPLRNEDYGRTCGIKDPCGNTWWITAIRA